MTDEKKDFEEFLTVSTIRCGDAHGLRGYASDRLAIETPDVLQTLWWVDHSIGSSYQAAKRVLPEILFAFYEALQGGIGPGWDHWYFTLSEKFDAILKDAYKLSDSVPIDVSRSLYDYVGKYLFVWGELKISSTASEKTDGTELGALEAMGSAKYYKGLCEGTAWEFLRFQEEINGAPDLIIEYGTEPLKRESSESDFLRRLHDARHEDNRRNADRLKIFIESNAGRWRHLGDSWRNKAADDAARELGINKKTARNRLVGFKLPNGKQ